MQIPLTYDLVISGDSVISNVPITLSDCPSTQNEVVNSARQSVRNINRPKWWLDYQIPTSSKPKSNLVQVNTASLPKSLTPLPVHLEPQRYFQAVTIPKWVEVMQKELQALGT